MPSRRSALRALPAVLGAGVAGCLGDGGSGTDNGRTTAPVTTGGGGSAATDGAEPAGTTDGTGTPESTATHPPEGTVRTLGDLRVSVADPVARKAVAYESLMGSGGVLAPEGRQFAVAAVRSTPRSGPGSGAFDAGGDPPRDAFSLVVGDGSYPAVGIEDRTTGARTAALAGRGDLAYGTPTADGWETGWIAFEPPSPVEPGAGDARPRIRCEYGDGTGTWSLHPDAVATLARPAATFELRSFAAERADGGADVELSLVAENTAEVDGRFLAAVYLPTRAIADDDESHLVERSVAAGDTVEWTERFDARYLSAEDGTLDVRAEGVVSGSATVEVGTGTGTPR
jgi:hypothetical protein